MLLWALLFEYLFEPLFSVLLGHILQCGIAGSYGNSVFNFLRLRISFEQFYNSPILSHCFTIRTNEIIKQWRNISLFIYTCPSSNAFSQMNISYIIYLPSPQLNVGVSEGPGICPKSASREVDEGTHKSWITVKLPVNSSESRWVSWAWDMF